MHRLRVSRYLLAAALSLIASTPVTAQSDYAMSPVQFPSSFNMNVMSQIGKVYSDPSALEKSLEMRLQERAGNHSALIFKPSLVRRKANLAAFVAKARATNPQGAAELEAMFRSEDVIESMDRMMQQSADLRANDLAAAYAIWWMNSWQAAHGDVSDTSRATAQAVRAQAAYALMANPAIANSSDAAKQELAEALLVQAQLIGSLLMAYHQDAGMKRKVALTARNGAREMGLDLTAMTLTEDGFVPAKRKVGALNNAPDVRHASSGDGLLFGVALAGLGVGGLWLVRGKKVGG